MKETKSNWECVTELMTQNSTEIVLGKYDSYCYHKTPQKMLHSLSYYKFAAKLIGKNKRVLDLGCKEGLGTWLVAKECGFAQGVDFDEQAIRTARTNFTDPNIEFSSSDVLEDSPEGIWDAVINFDVIEHIYPDQVEQFIGGIKAALCETGLAIFGTPSLVSQQFASEVSKQGHENIYSPEALEEEMRRHFEYVFIFAASDEVVHTGYLPLAHYLIAVCCKQKTTQNR
jgi:2-polyprenyl-3-methyl-5-hydroxy-6-metoxy-1,4-benzoquinol methylase